MANIDSPKNEAEFVRFIEEIDNQLKGKGILIQQRPLFAASEACRKLGFSTAHLVSAVAIAGIYEGDSLIGHIYKWYEFRYGDRIKIDFSPGVSMILIRGDPWRIKFPLLYGQFKLIFSPDYQKYRKSLSDGDNNKIDAFSLIQGLTPDYLRALKRDEIVQIAERFCRSFRAIQRIDEVVNKPFVEEAKIDMLLAVESLFARSPNYGQSKWASLQATEKMFKSYLRLEGVRFPYKHDLSILADLAFSHGLQIIPKEVIELAQCAAGARYGEINATLLEATLAHYSSLDIAFIIASTIKAYEQQDYKCYETSNGVINRIEEGRFYVLPSLNYYYYSKKVEGDLIKFILLESYQNGNLFQGEFNVLKQDAQNYKIATSENKLRSLNNLLKNYER